MGTTANYSWPTPVATDLVKNGWEAIKDLGDAADTTVKAVSDAQGLVYLNTTNYSAVASQSINNVFSATYNNYLILINNSTSSASSSLYMRLRASGTDDTGATSYQRSGYASNPSTLSNAYLATDKIFIGTISSGVTVKTPIQLFEPFNANATTGYLTTFDQPTNNSWGLNFAHIAATSYDGFTILAGSGTITGTIRVYGYKNS